VDFPVCSCHVEIGVDHMLMRQHCERANKLLMKIGCFVANCVGSLTCFAFIPYDDLCLQVIFFFLQFVRLSLSNLI